MAFKAFLIPQDDKQELLIRIADSSARVDLHRRKGVWQIRTDLDMERVDPSHVTESDKIWTAMVDGFESTLLSLICAWDKLWPIETASHNAKLFSLLADVVVTTTDAISNNFDE